MFETPRGEGGFVLRRPIVLALIGAAALVLAVAPAFGALVTVRVEGKTQTIFGATQPKAVATNALDALEAASLAGEFYYHVAQTSFGPYVDQIGRYPGAGSTGWVFKVDNASPPVGADKVVLKDGDSVLWYYADFSSGSAPKTLGLVVTKPGCYRVIAYDDAGTAAPAPGAVLRVDGRTLKGSFTSTCIGPHKGLVRATASGMVRSNAAP
jgi:Domain of unknown function (DUF4430)